MEHRFAIGAGILVLPLIAASFACLIDWLWVGRKERRHFVRLAWVFGTLVLGIVVVYFVLKPPLDTIAAAGALVVIAVLGVLHLCHGKARSRHAGSTSNSPYFCRYLLPPASAP